MDFPVPDQLITNKTEAITRGTIQDKKRELPFYSDPIYRPPSRPPENLQLGSTESKPDTRPKIDNEFEENSLYQEGIISETYQRPEKSDFQEPRDLESLVNTGTGGSCLSQIFWEHENQSGLSVIWLIYIKF